MNESRQHIDDLFKEGLEHYELEAPMHVWDRIDQKRTPVYKLVNNFKQNYRWYMSVVAGLAIMSSAAVMLLSDGNHGNIPANAKSNQMTIAENHQVNPSTLTEGDKSELNAEQGAVASDLTDNQAYDYSKQSAAHTRKASQNQVSASVQPEATSSQEIFNSSSSNRSTNPPATPINDPVSNESNDNSSQALTEVASNEVTEVANNEVVVPKDNQLEVASATEASMLNAAENVESESNQATASEEAEANASTQVKLTPPYIPSKWSIEAMGSYSVIQRSLSGDEAYTSLRNSTDQMKSAFTLQVRGMYKINSRLGVQTGLSFTKMNERMTFQQPYEVREVKDRWVTGYVLDPILGPRQVQYQVKDTVSHTEYKDVVSDNSYTFVDLPIMLNYTVLKGSRLSLYANAGAILNLKFGQKGQMIQRDMKNLIELNGSDNPYKVRANVDFNLGLGLAFKPVKSSPVDILFEPNVRFGTGSLLNNTFGIKQTFTTYNLFLGVRYNF